MHSGETPNVKPINNTFASSGDTKQNLPGQTKNKEDNPNKEGEPNEEDDSNKEDDPNEEVPKEKNNSILKKCNNNKKKTKNKVVFNLTNNKVYYIK